MKSRLAVLLLVSLSLGGVVFSATAQESFYEETFSLYGYVVNFFNVNLYADDWRVTDSDYGNVLYGRLKGDWNPGDNLSFHAELAYQGSVGNQNLYLLYDSYGLGSLIFDGPATETEDETQFDYPFTDFVQTVYVDHLWGSVNLGCFDVQFGKLPIAWGTGYFFNPTNRTSVIPFLEMVSEETPGTIGVIPSVSFFEGLLSIQGYAAFQDKTHSTFPKGAEGDWANLPFGVKLQGILGAFDLSCGWVKEVLYLSDSDEFYRRHYATSDFAGAIWNFGIYGEAALRLWDESQKELAFEYEPVFDLVEFCVGFDYLVPVLEIDARLEYYHYGPGTRNKSDYALSITKLLSGEQMVLAEDYLLFYLERSFLDYFKIGTAGFTNLNDGSLGLFPELSGEPYGNLQVALGGMLFLGDEGSELAMNDPAVYLRCKLSF